jgi:O-antigen/teichoic acid export membrane protein
VSENKRLAKNIFALLIVQLTNYVAPLLVFPYLTRILSIENFGLIALSFSICSLALILTDFGFALSASYWMTKNRSNKAEVMRYTGAIYVAKMILAFISIGLFLVYTIYFQVNFLSHIWLTTGIILTIFFQAFQPIWFFQGIEKMKNVTICMVTSKIIYVLIVFMFVKSNDDFETVLLSLAVSAFIASALGLYRIYQENYGLLIPPVRKIADVLSSSLSFFLSRAAVGIYTSASTFIVGNFSGLMQAAIYSSAEKLYQAGQSATSPLSQALFPHLARSRKEDFLIKVLCFILPALILVISLCMYYAPDLLSIFYGDTYKSATPVLRVFLLTSVFTFISVNLGYPAFAIYDKLGLVNLSVYLAAILHASCLTFLYCTESISAYNISVCVCLVEFCVLFLRISMFIYIRNKAKKNGN